MSRTINNIYNGSMKEMISASKECLKRYSNELCSLNNAIEKLNNSTLRRDKHFKMVLSIIFQRRSRVQLLLRETYARRQEPIAVVSGRLLGRDI